MDIFNKKRVEELENELKRLKNVERDLDQYKELLAEAERDLANCLNVKSQLPEDCTPGDYCKACEFSKEYYYRHYSYRTHDAIFKGHLCNKANVCKNFTQKEVPNGKK